MAFNSPQIDLPPKSDVLNELSVTGLVVATAPPTASPQPHNIAFSSLHMMFFYFLCDHGLDF